MFQYSNFILSRANTSDFNRLLKAIIGNLEVQGLNAIVDVITLVHVCAMKTL